MSASRRQSLADLVPKAAPTEEAPPPVAVAAPEPPAALVAVPPATLAPAPAEPVSEAVAVQPAEAEAPTRTPRRPKAAAVPRYLQLERKEVRITAGQYDRLTALARQLNRQRPRGSGGKEGERITENTLIRIAIDLLLAQDKGLCGASEDELRKSVLP